MCSIFYGMFLNTQQALFLPILLSSSSLPCYHSNQHSILLWLYRPGISPHWDEHALPFVSPSDGQLNCRSRDFRMRMTTNLKILLNPLISQPSLNMWILWTMHHGNHAATMEYCEKDEELDWIKPPNQAGHLETKDCNAKQHCQPKHWLSGVKCLYYLHAYITYLTLA